MPELPDTLEPALSPAQAAELALLIDLEARWENLRVARSPATQEPSTTVDLNAKQKAYDAFRGRMRAYNARHTPAHVPELLLNTAARLGKWCRQMQELYRLAEHDPRVGCPVHLLEKAYRSAGRVAGRVGKAPPVRTDPPETMAAALRDLEALAEWCDGPAAAA
jgi:hypothetical protein